MDDGMFCSKETAMSYSDWNIPIKIDRKFCVSLPYSSEIWLTGVHAWGFKWWGIHSSYQGYVFVNLYNLGVHWIKTVRLLWLVTEQLTENSCSIPSHHFSWSASPPMLWKVCWFLLFLFQKPQTRPLQVSCPSLDLFLSPRAPSTVQWWQLCLQWCYNKKDNNNLISELSCWFISSV